MGSYRLPFEPNQSRSVEFPQLLKKWRKLKRVSQLDFSLDAGISQRHLSFMESGRSKPSREMVLTLSDALDLPLRERNLLLHAAGFAQVYQQRSLESDEMKVVNNALQMSLDHHEPYPAIVVDRNWNLLMKNQAAQKLVSLLGEPEDVWQRVDPSGNKNVYKLTFSGEGMRPLISNWDELSKHLLIRLQREIEADPDNQFLMDLFNELVEMDGVDNSDEFVSDPIAPIVPTQLKYGEIELKIFSMISSFGTAQDVTAEELKVETFFPADDFTKLVFQRLAAN